MTTRVGRAELSSSGVTVLERADRGAFWWAVTRVLLGFIFLWAFVDKTFALGFGHGRLEDGTIDKAAAWIEGGSPTEGFLTFGTKGPFAEAFGSIAGAAWADWLFMIGLLGIGLALIFGVGVRIAAITGALMLMLMYFAAVPWVTPSHNPLVDDHLVYAVVLGGLAAVDAGDHLGLGRWWRKRDVVDRHPILR